MQVEIISIGTELLLGDILNTNAQYLAQQLAMAGMTVYHQVVVGDNSQRLKDTFNQALKRSDIVIATGGMGPTEDDLSKEVVADILGLDLVFDEQSWQEITNFIKQGGYTIGEYNRKQAYFPTDARILKNNLGTAPGCIVAQNQKVVILLPGPPEEMKPMFEEQVRPYLAGSREGTILSKTLCLYGIGEGEMAEMLSDLINGQTNPTIAPYARKIGVILRITARATTEAKAKELIHPMEKKVRQRLQTYIYGSGDDTLEKVVTKLLLEKGLTLAVAESCTGGLIASKLINHPGASKMFLEGAVTYSNAAKINRLHVPAEMIAVHGAVSPEVAEAMAKGIALTAASDIGLAVTGIAGPGGGTPNKPVGLAYIGIYFQGKSKANKVNFPGDRQIIRGEATAAAFDMLRKELED